MEFDSINAAKNFYNFYGFEAGFSTSRSDADRYGNIFVVIEYIFMF